MSAKTTQSPADQPLAFPLKVAAVRLGLPVRKLQRLVRMEEIGCKKVSPRTRLFTEEDLRRYLAGERPLRRRRQ